MKFNFQLKKKYSNCFLSKKIYANVPELFKAQLVKYLPDFVCIYSIKSLNFSKGWNQFKVLNSPVSQAH